MKKIFNILLLSILFTGCTVTKEVIREVPVEVVKTEYKTQYVHDSVYLHDSTFIVVKGDTVFNNVYKTKYIQKTVHDTLITHDTIPQPVTITETKIVEKKVPQWWPVWLVACIIGLYFLITKTKFISAIKDFIKYIILIFK